MSPPLLLHHWLKFNAVGAIGIVVQLAALAILKGWLQVEYLLATALAVEAAVLHNFIWHERWTWAERTKSNPESRLPWVRRARFNLLFMRLLTGRLHVQYLIASLLSIAAASPANFLLSELFVFRG